MICEDARSPESVRDVGQRKQTTILCILNGGIGDQVLAMPALRYLASSLPAARVEDRRDLYPM